MQFVVAYDIAHPLRLRRVARRMEKLAVRSQKSVFIFSGSETALQALLDEVAIHLHPSEDSLQAWPVSRGATRATPARSGKPSAPLYRGRRIDIRPSAIVLARNISIHLPGDST